MSGGGIQAPARQIAQNAGAEPWSPVETRLVVWSFVAAAIALILGGILVNVYLL